MASRGRKSNPVKCSMGESVDRELIAEFFAFVFNPTAGNSIHFDPYHRRLNLYHD